MYLHLGRNTVVPYASILGIFDLDNTTGSHLTRRFLEQAEREHRVFSVSEELPKSFVLCQENDRCILYLSQLSPATLLKRVENRENEGVRPVESREDIHGGTI
ncbi:MAG: DUF370 domain-containing protein [Oscillospiraceae bacterium]|nr:DUF370 domain-containing protein [Oscillospiraceae bacterium]